MKPILLTCTALALFTGCAPQAPAPDRAADIAALSHAKVHTWRALYRNQDADGLEAFLHDEFMFIPGGGDVISKENEVSYLRENPVDMADDFLYTVDDIIFTGPDSAIVYGKGNSTRTNDAGKPCAHSYWSSNTFRRVGKKWKPTFSHVSGSKCDAIN